MAEAGIEAIATCLAWLAAHGIDVILGKWLAYFTIAWENQASKASKASFDQAMGRIKTQSPAKAQAWADWRARATNATGSSQNVP